MKSRTPKYNSKLGRLPPHPKIPRGTARSECRCKAAMVVEELALKGLVSALKSGFVYAGLMLDRDLKR